MEEQEIKQIQEENTNDDIDSFGEEQSFRKPFPIRKVLLIAYYIGVAALYYYVFHDKLSDIFTLGSSEKVAFFSNSKWDGTWSTPDGKIIVNLNSSTMKANVKIMLGDTPVNYTTDWEYITGGVIYSDYASNQETIIKNDGSMYGYNANTGQLIDYEMKMRKR